MSCLSARGESLAAFDERCIPAGGVAPPSNTPGILSRRALPAGRFARLGATPDFHHGLLTHVRRFFGPLTPECSENGRKTMISCLNHGNPSDTIWPRRREFVVDLASVER